MLDGRIDAQGPIQDLRAHGLVVVEGERGAGWGAEREGSHLSRDIVVEFEAKV
ncbi:hypothetical protein K443DRAFT_684504 [Laccaria amethystina LaAM-08-1]|uniref:Uncharacterized protein n=1 Tax=Laccaria amethystina LaAM-08-1 TaxID=1095629 RepID=A0A0C9XBA9_9AGAR|nr:hypothetical protein K443DRAFT_684504 [Laccaria amethystina LaAM-08-1]